MRAEPLFNPYSMQGEFTSLEKLARGTERISNLEADTGGVGIRIWCILCGTTLCSWQTRSTHGVGGGPSGKAGFLQVKRWRVCWHGTPCISKCSYSDTNRKVLLCLSHTATGTSHSRSLTPDDDVFQYLAYTYASRNPTMKKGDQCKNKMNFPSGITNGYSWYPLKGKCLFPSSILLLTCLQRCQLAFVDPSSCQSLLRMMLSLLSCLCQLMSQKQGDGGCSDCPRAVQILAQRLPTWAGNYTRKVARMQPLPSGLIGKSNVQLSNCGGSVIRIKRRDL